jgi:hypothetical protein
MRVRSEAQSGAIIVRHVQTIAMIRASVKRGFVLGFPSSAKSCQKSPVLAVYPKGRLTRLQPAAYRSSRGETIARSSHRPGTAQASRPNRTSATLLQFRPRYHFTP